MNAEAGTQVDLAENSASSVREIYKNGWLKKIPSERRTGPFSKAPKADKIWVVFCIHEEKEPFLEYYENRRSAYSHKALYRYDLQDCLHISPTILIQEDDYEFAVTLGSQVLRLAAPTQELMSEWLDVLGNKLRDLGILQLKDNVYSREPTSPQNGGMGGSPLPDSSTRGSTRILADIQSEASGSSNNGPSTSTERGRDPNSPLPPIPQIPSAALTTFRIGDQIAPISGSTVSYVRSPRTSQPSPPVLLQHSPAVDSQISNDVFSFDFVASSLYGSAREESASGLQSNTLYEPLYRSGENDPPQQCTNMNDNNHGASAQLVRRRSESEIPRLQLGHNQQTSRMTANRPIRVNSVCSYSQLHAQGLGFPHRQPPPLEEGPPSYEPISSQSSVEEVSPTSEVHPNNNMSSSRIDNTNTTTRSSGHQVLSLKELQVQTLQKEISHKGGVRLMLRKKDCAGVIAFVEAFGGLWVAGWKQKDHPLLHNTFHVGDKILTIGGQTISTVQEAQKALKMQPLLVEFVVQRVPHGKVLAIKRDFEGQDLGIIRDGSTAEIKEVCSNGLVARYGLPAKSPTVDGFSLCTWTLTEVNGRPLNLFFKDNQVQERLNAVGRDISILVQPTDLVRYLRKQLKAVRSYKDYIVQ